MSITKVHSLSRHTQENQINKFGFVEKRRRFKFGGHAAAKTMKLD